MKPIVELERLLTLHELYLQKTLPEERITVDQALALKMQQALTQLGYYSVPRHGEYDEATRKSFEHYCHVENFEERICSDNVVDSRVLNFLLSNKT